MLHKLRSTLIDDADEFKFLIHTSLDTIDVENVWHRYKGFVAIEGEDENYKYRFLVFSDHSFGMSEFRNQPIRFVGFKAALTCG